jgi:hypothetical protein
MESGRKPLGWWVLVGAAGILVVGLVVQVVLSNAKPAADPARPTSGQSSASVAPTASSSQRADIACLEYPPLPNPAAPAYQGPGPHLIIPGSPGPAFAISLYAPQIDEGYLPSNWLPANHTEFTAHWWNSSMASLIVCPTEVRQTASKPVGTCEWIDSPPSKAYPANWTFAVYEIRTGRKLTTFTLPSDNSRGAICPSSMQSPASDSAQPPGEAALKTALTPLVMKNLP